MRLVKLYESDESFDDDASLSPMLDVMRGSIALLKERLEEDGFYVIGDMVGLAGLAYVRALDPIHPIFSVTVTIQKDKWPITIIDAGLSGYGVVERGQLNLGEPDFLDKLSRFASKYIPRNQEEMRDVQALAKKHSAAYEENADFEEDFDEA